MPHETYLLLLQVVIILGCGILIYLAIRTGLLKRVYGIFSFGISFFSHWVCFIFRKPMTIFYFTRLQEEVALSAIPYIWKTRTGLINFFIRLIFFILIVVPAAFTINPLGFLSIYSYLIFSVLSDALIGAFFQVEHFYPIPFYLVDYSP